MLRDWLSQCLRLLTLQTHLAFQNSDRARGARGVPALRHLVGTMPIFISAMYRIEGDKVELT